MTEIATIQKNSREELRVTLETFNGHELVNLRVWYQREDGEWRPGKQGVALRTEKLPEFMSAIGDAYDAVFSEAAA